MTEDEKKLGQVAVKHEESSGQLIWGYGKRLEEQIIVNEKRLQLAVQIEEQVVKDKEILELPIVGYG